LLDVGGAQDLAGGDAALADGDHSASCRSITGTNHSRSGLMGSEPAGWLMTGKCKASGADAPTVLAEATESVQKATEAVQTTSRSIAESVEADRRPDAPLDRLASLTREAPLQSLAIAFLLGFIVARRR
jgi:hypothetical protein